MCIGENCARQAVRYVNAQLSAHYENAVDCVNNHNQYQKPTQKSSYSHALAGFTYSSKKQTLFRATFDKPRLEFICNHDAILRLKIKSATYRLDVVNNSVINHSGRDDLQVPADKEVVFRIPFTSRNLDGAVLKHNHGQNPLQVIILDMTKAHLVSELVPSIGRDVLVHYLQEYLLFLAEAGNHVFFSLPSFDDERYHLTIDYSTMDEKDRTVLEVGDMYGVSVDKINEYLSSVWLKAKLASSENKDWKSYCLAEYRSIRGSVPGLDALFHVRLRPLRLQPLCAREAILYFSVDEILFYEDADFTKDPLRKYTGWQIAVLVDVDHHFEHDSVIKLTLDLASARPLATHCTHGDSVPEEDQLAKNYWTCIVDFFTSVYIQSANLHVVYFFDSRWPIAPQTPSDEEESEDEESSDTEEDPVRTSIMDKWTEAIKMYLISGFDRVIVVSQSSINAIFGLLWARGQAQGHRDREVVEWHYEESFDAHFQPMTVRLLSNERAIIWVHLKHGNFKVLKDEKPVNESTKWHFEGWHLAFEVNLKKVAHSVLETSASGSWITRYKNSVVFQEHGDREDRTIEYILLDLDVAEFLYEFSSFGSLFHQPDGQTPNPPSPADQVLAVVHYIRKYYLPHIARSGLNIIQAIPIRKPETSLTSVTLTMVQFHVWSRETITHTNWAQATGSSEPVIMIIGMTEFRPLPSLPWKPSPGLIMRPPGGSSYGNVTVSRSAFLGHCILDPFSIINACTTLIPVSSCFVDNQLDLRLTTWDNSAWKQKRCSWQEVFHDTTDIMEYKWERNDHWDTGETENVRYSISSEFTSSC
ncbi:hypothetical protein DAEQUDRAFT_676750 [Daedalea quercina L-15889]|uniref:Uncharacterized protein n=1 Tax=Daedalea quercina L-15889 TaxID=1314783 RepID=A0A165MBF6_9APHY|nr:hypothetical protein DAEQUDRAFT_676750 [Daedalea quercina L-15889]